MLYLSIDQHRKHLTISLRDEEGRVIRSRQVSTEPKRVREFLEEVSGRARDAGGFMAILEVCGFNEWLIELLQESECREVVLVHPDQRSKQKTDRRDANALGELLWVNRQHLAAGRRPQKLRRVFLVSRRDREDRQVTALRQRLGRQRTRTLNQIQRILNRHNLMWECPTKTFQTKAVRRWLEELSLPEIDRLELDQLLAQWDLWEQQIAQADQTIRERAVLREDVRLLQSVPGMAAYSGLLLASRIGPVERFPGPRSLANYFGLTPGCRNSGVITDRLGSITKQGSRPARFILGQLVLHILKKDPWMRGWYKRIKRRRGSKIARVAVMRRLCTILWHMLTRRERYLVGGPPRRRLPKTAAPPVACAAR